MLMCVCVVNCMQGSSHSGYMKCGEFIDWIGNCQLLTELVGPCMRVQCIELSCMRCASSKHCHETSGCTTWPTKRLLDVFAKLRKASISFAISILYTETCTCMISRRILLRMRCFGQKLQKNQNTHFVFSNFFSPKIVPFVRSSANILQSGAGHR